MGKYKQWTTGTRP